MLRALSWVVQWRGPREMRRLVGLILICVSIATSSVALFIFGSPIRYLPGTPPEPGGNVAYVVDVEVTATAFFVLPLLAVFALGIVLLVLPRPKRRDLPPSGDAP